MDLSEELRLATIRESDEADRKSEAFVEWLLAGSDNEGVRIKISVRREDNGR